MNTEQEMDKKYKLDKEDTIEVDGKTLYRIVALRDVGDGVEAGDKGGYVESDKNLSHKGNAWVYDKAKVLDDAYVCGGAYVCGNAYVHGNAKVYNNAKVCGNAEVYGNAKVYENARVFGSARVCGGSHVCWDANVFGNALVSDEAEVFGRARVFDDARVFGNARIFNDAYVGGDAWVSGHAKVLDDARVFGNADYFCVQSFGSVGRTTTFFRTETGWLISCGCFNGTIEEFRNQVKKTHGDTFIAQEYLMIADLMDLRIKRREQEAQNGAYSRKI